MNRGLTLIEMAIILVLLGLLVGIGASLLGPLTKRMKYTEAKDTLNANVESLIGYASVNNCLPDTSYYAQVIRSIKDPWGKDFLYIPADELNGSECTYTAGICQRKSTSLEVRRCNDSECTSYTSVNNVAFAMISGGLNYNIQTAEESGVIKVYEPGQDNVDDYSGDFSRKEDYDDIVKWITLSELKIKIGCGWAPLKILNNELPVGYQNQNYYPPSGVNVYAEGGIPYSSGGSYEWCYEGTLPSGMNINVNACPNWTQTDHITLSGTPTDAGSFLLTFQVKDRGGNESYKKFVLTINAASP